MNVAQNPLQYQNFYNGHAAGPNFLGNLIAGAGNSFARHRAMPIAQYQQNVSDNRQQMIDENKARIEATLRARGDVDTAIAREAAQAAFAPPKAGAALTQDYDPMTGLPAKNADGSAKMSDSETASNHLRSFTARKAPGGAYQGFDPDAVAEGIVAGAVPPDPQGFSRGQWGSIVSSIRKNHKDYPVAVAQTDYAAVRKNVASMNAPQQLRMRQAISTLPNILDQIDGLADRVASAGSLKELNRAALGAAKRGSFGPDARNAALALESKVANAQFELGFANMGGNAPTDQAFKHAGEVLGADWGKGGIKAQTKALRDYIGIRESNLNQPALLLPAQSPAAPWMPGQPAPAPTTPAAPTGTVKWKMVRGNLVRVE